MHTFSIGDEDDIKILAGVKINNSYNSYRQDKSAVTWGTKRFSYEKIKERCSVHSPQAMGYRNPTRRGTSTRQKKYRKKKIIDGNSVGRHKRCHCMLESDVTKDTGITNMGVCQWLRRLTRTRQCAARDKPGQTAKNKNTVR